jgi:hypothetical protein
MRSPQRATSGIRRVRRVGRIWRHGTVDPLPVFARRLVVAITGGPDEMALGLGLRLGRLRRLRRRIPPTAPS